MPLFLFQYSITSVTYSLLTLQSSVETACSNPGRAPLSLAEVKTWS